MDVNTKNTVKKITDIAEMAAGVNAVHSPSPSAGEKIIYRYTPGSYDGEFETCTVTMRFISRNISDAVKRAECVSLALCSDDIKSALSADGTPVFVVRKQSGSSGYIGKTGHYFVIAAFEVNRRMTASSGDGTAERM